MLLIVTSRSFCMIKCGRLVISTGWHEKSGLSCTVSQSVCDPNPKLHTTLPGRTSTPARYRSMIPSVSISLDVVGDELEEWPAVTRLPRSKRLAYQLLVLFSRRHVLPRSSRRAAIQVLWSRTDHSAYAVLRDTVTALAERYNPGLDVSDATNLAWSAMQGLIVLYPKISLVRREDRAGRRRRPDHRRALRSAARGGVLRFFSVRTRSRRVSLE